MSKGHIIKLLVIVLVLGWFGYFYFFGERISLPKVASNETYQDQYYYFNLTRFNPVTRKAERYATSDDGGSVPFTRQFPYDFFEKENSIWIFDKQTARVRKTSIPKHNDDEIFEGFSIPNISSDGTKLYFTIVPKELFTLFWSDKKSPEVSAKIKDLENKVKSYEYDIVHNVVHPSNILERGKRIADAYFQKQTIVESSFYGEKFDVGRQIIFGVCIEGENSFTAKRRTTVKKYPCYVDLKNETLTSSDVFLEESDLSSDSILYSPRLSLLLVFSKDNQGNHRVMVFSPYEIKQPKHIFTLSTIPKEWALRQQFSSWSRFEEKLAIEASPQSGFDAIGLYVLDLRSGDLQTIFYNTTRSTRYVGGVSVNSAAFVSNDRYLIFGNGSELGVYDFTAKNLDYVSP